MQGRKIALALVATLVGILVVAAACSPTQPTAPPNVTVINNNTNTNNNGGGTPSSPAPGSNGAIAVVKIGAFGLACPAGVKVPSADRTIPVGCQMAVTCTPKDINGVLVSPAVTGPKPDFFDAVNGKGNVVRVAAWDEEAFNLNVTGVNAGSFSLSCISKGVKSDAWDGQVVAP